MIDTKVVDLVATAQVSGSDMSVDITSSNILIAHTDSLAIQSVYTGTPAGSFFVYFSLDGVNFSQLATTDIAAAGSYYFDFTNPKVTAMYFQFKFVHNVGSAGTLTKLMYAVKG
jgi:hypothetical protein